MFKVGDIILKTNSTGQMSWLIRKFTFSNITHAAIVNSPNTLLEMDWKLKAQVNPLTVYNPKDLIVYRPKLDMGEVLKLEELCKKYDGSPYSIWDIITNAATFALAPKIRKDIVMFLGNKKHMVCSELVARIVYETNMKKFECLKQFEAIRPDDLRTICQQNPEIFREVTNEICSEQS